MSGGYFTRTYTVWRDVTTRDPATGAVIHAWAKVADVMGRAYVTSMADTFASAMPLGIIGYTFACAAGADIRVADQVRFDGRTLAVQTVSVTSRGDRLQCLCKEIQ